MWPFKKRKKPEPAFSFPEIDNVPTVLATHAVLRAAGYEPVGHPEDDGEIKWKLNAELAKRIAEAKANNGETGGDA